MVVPIWLVIADVELAIEFVLETHFVSVVL